MWHAGRPGRTPAPHPEEGLTMTSPTPLAAPPADPVPPTVCAAQGLTKVYGSDKTRVVALDAVDVAFAHGSFTAILGPSGSGKSTLMHCLAGLDRVSAGRVFLGGRELSALSDKELTRVRRDQVGFVFQAFNLLPTLTARQNIVLPLDLAGRKPDADHLDQIVASLGLGDRLDHRPSELSGGQQQRVAIARALVTRPDVIFADEPTGALDSRNSAALLGYLQGCVRDLGQTIIMVTHDPKAAAHADRALVLLDGRIVDDLANPTVDSVNAALTRLDA
nr:ABC transporter ATP-binding protein [Propionibacterium sp.]